MTNYTLNLAGGEVIEILAESDVDALRIATDHLGGDVVGAAAWEPDGLNGDNEPCKRLLFWASEEDAESDSGADAIAELSTTGRP